MVNERGELRRLKLFILAGEASGDRIGADIIRRLRNRADIGIAGVGGDAMLAEGLDPHFDIQQLQVMGFADVAKHLPRLLRLVRETAAHIIAAGYDGVVLVDYQEFSTLLAKRLKRLGFQPPIILAVAPSVWAWRPGRARKLHGVFDEILAVFPFEPEVMRRLGGPETHYVGHPASGTLPVVATLPERGLFTLLPGSRRGEIRRHMPLFGRVVRKLAKNERITGVVLPTLPRLEEIVCEAVSDWDCAVEIVADSGRLDEVYANTRIALASSGTVTLELALRGVPHVGTYVPDAIQALAYLIAGRPRILLPNVVAGAEIVPEELYGPGMTGRITRKLVELIEETPARARQLQHFGEVRKALAEGISGAKKEDAADRILSLLERQSV